VAENVKKKFWLIGPTCMGSINHRCETFEPPPRILPYLDAIQQIFPKTDISTYSRISCCNTTYTMQRFATKQCSPSNEMKRATM